MRRLALLLAPMLLAASPEPLAHSQLPDPTQEAAARALMATIRCLVCQGQSIADSDADMAGDMRALVRRRIAAGEPPAAVRDWLIARYGDYVSYDPPLSAADEGKAAARGHHVAPDRAGGAAIGPLRTPHGRAQRLLQDRCVQVREAVRPPDPRQMPVADACPGRVRVPVRRGSPATRRPRGERQRPI